MAENPFLNLVEDPVAPQTQISGNFKEIKINSLVEHVFEVRISILVFIHFQKISCFCNF